MENLERQEVYWILRLFGKHAVDKVNRNPCTDGTLNADESDWNPLPYQQPDVKMFPKTCESALITMTGTRVSTDNVTSIFLTKCWRSSWRRRCQHQNKSWGQTWNWRWRYRHTLKRRETTMLSTRIYRFTFNSPLSMLNSTKTFVKMSIRTLVGNMMPLLLERKSKFIQKQGRQGKSQISISELQLRSNGISISWIMLRNKDMSINFTRPTRTRHH